MLIKELMGIRVRLAELEELLSWKQDVLKRYELVSKHSRQIMLFISPEGRILEANETACAAYGYDRETLLSLNIKDLLPPDMRHLSNDQMNKAFEGEVLFEVEHMRKDGSVFPVEVSSSVAQIGKDNVNGRHSGDKLHRHRS